MSLLEIRRQSVIECINLNPSSISLKRKTEVKIGGGKVKSPPIELPVQVFRVYLKKTLSPKEFSSEGGKAQISPKGLLCAWDADVQDGDEFVLGGQQHRIVNVTSISLGGEKVSYQCMVEAVT